MATVNLNAEIYEALSVIAKDESLLKRAVRSLKRLAAQKENDALMTEDEVKTFKPAIIFPNNNRV